MGEDELAALSANKRRDFSHIGRIMETELGQELQGKERCSACQANSQECWIYSQRGAQQISRPGDTCARCRVAARPGGCSLSKRGQKSKDRSPLAPAEVVIRSKPRIPAEVVINREPPVLGEAVINSQPLVPTEVVTNSEPLVSPEVVIKSEPPVPPKVVIKSEPSV